MYKILIVDDVAVITMQLELLLQEYGYEVVGNAINGDVAIKEAREKKPDLVIMDINMPGCSIDGIAAATRIRDELNIPSIFLSAYADDATIERAKIAQPIGYIVKPFQEVEIKAVLETAIFKLEADKNLAEQAKFLETIINSLTYPFCVINSDHTVALSNSAAGDTHDGMCCYQLLHNSDKPCADLPCIVEMVKSNGLPATVEHIHYDKDGNSVNVEVHGYPIKDKNGSVVQVIEYGLDITKRKEVESELQQSREQLRNLSERLQLIREEERNRIAREVHDELGQTLTGLKLDMAALVRKSPDLGDAQVERLNEMGSVIDYLVRTVQRITTDLRPLILYDLGLVAAIQWQVEKVGRQSGFNCEVILTSDDLLESGDVTLSEERSIAVFRIFQEALTNIIRHASASSVVVTISMDNQYLIISTEDNGIGVSLDSINDPFSLGLLGMRERAHFLGGALTISAGEQDGTIVKIVAPLSANGDYI